MPLILSSAFPLVPNKEKAWLDIIRLVDFKDSQVDRKLKKINGFNFLKLIKRKKKHGQMYCNL